MANPIYENLCGAQVTCEGCPAAGLDQPVRRAVEQGVNNELWWSALGSVAELTPSKGPGMAREALELADRGKRSIPEMTRKVLGHVASGAHHDVNQPSQAWRRDRKVLSTTRFTPEDE